MISQRTSRRSAVWAGVALAFAFAISAAHAQDVIKIAAGAPLTGPLAKQGQEVANAVKLAVDEWNAKGGVLGKKIEVMDADDQGNPQVGVAAGEKVAADPAVHGRRLGHHQRHLHPGLGGARSRQPRLDHARAAAIPKVTDRGAQDRQPAVRPRRFPGPGRHHLRRQRAQGEEDRDLRRRHHRPARRRRRGREEGQGDGRDRRCAT